MELPILSNEDFNFIKSSFLCEMTNTSTPEYWTNRKTEIVSILEEQSTKQFVCGFSWDSVHIYEADYMKSPQHTFTFVIDLPCEMGWDKFRLSRSQTFELFELIINTVDMTNL